MLHQVENSIAGFYLVCAFSHLCSLKLVDEVAYNVVRQRKMEFQEEKLRNPSGAKTENNGDEIKIKKGKGYDIISLYLQRHDEESNRIMCLHSHP